MMQSFVQTLGKPVWSHVQARVVGVIVGVLLDEERGVITEFMVKVGWWQPVRWLSASDVILWAEKCVIQEESDLYEEADVLRLANRPGGSKYGLLGYRVVSEQQQGLGYCRDWFFETTGFYLTHLIVGVWRWWRSEQRILSRQNIKEIRPQTVVVFSNTKERKAKKAMAPGVSSSLENVPGYTLNK